MPALLWRVSPVILHQLTMASFIPLNLALAFYEYSITFAEEVQVIWSRRCSVTTILLITLRWNTLVLTVASALYGSPTVSHSDIFHVELILIMTGFWWKYFIRGSFFHAILSKVTLIWDSLAAKRGLYFTMHLVSSPICNYPVRLITDPFERRSDLHYLSLLCITDLSNMVG